MRDRVKRAQAELRARRISEFLVTNPVNIYYLTGLKVSAGSLILSQKSAELFLDQRYVETAKRRAKVVYSTHDSSEVKARISSLESIAIEAEFVTAEDLTVLQRSFKNTKFVQTNGLIQGLRQVKDKSEISQISHACALTRRVLRRVPSLLTPGVTEHALANRLHILCLEMGASGMAFETIVGFGSHTAIPHHRPTDRKFKPGDLVQIDMGSKVGEYCSDFSRVFRTAPFTPEQRHAYRALLKAKKATESMLRPGVSTHALDAAARSSLKEDGYDKEFCHALGHAVGLEIHDGLVLSPKKADQALRRGEVITIEPGLYFPGRFGMRIEDTHIVGY